MLSLKTKYISLSRLQDIADRIDTSDDQNLKNIKYLIENIGTKNIVIQNLLLNNMLEKMGINKIKIIKQENKYEFIKKKLNELICKINSDILDSELNIHVLEFCNIITQVCDLRDLYICPIIKIFNKYSWDRNNFVKPPNRKKLVRDLCLF